MPTFQDVSQTGERQFDETAIYNDVPGNRVPAEAMNAPIVQSRLAVRVLAAVVATLMAWLLLECGLWLLFRVLPNNVVFYDPAAWVVPLADVQAQNDLFDAELGWLPRPATPDGERARDRSLSPVVATFGDSFTYGDEVADDETWQEQFAREVGVGILNLGVGGYGIDQAVLRYDRYAAAAAVRRTVVLAFASENINRNVNVWRKFYFPKTRATFTKPRFILKDSGLVLVTNPIASVAERSRLADPQFVSGLGLHDAWCNRGHLPALGFPYVRILFAPEFWRQVSPGSTRRSSDVDAAPSITLWDEPAARELTLALLARFAGDALRRGDRPVLLHLPSQSEVVAFRDRGDIPSSVQVLDTACAEKGWTCWFPLRDAKALFPAPGAMFAPGGHYNVAGNAAIARYLARRIGRNGEVSTLTNAR